MRIPDSTGDVLRMHGTPFMSAATGMPTRALLKLFYSLRVTFVRE